MRFLNLSRFQQKLAAGLFVVTASTAILTLAASTWNANNKLEQYFESEHYASQRMIADSIAAALAFEDKVAARGVLEYAGKNPGIMQICVYNKDRRLFDQLQSGEKNTECPSVAASNVPTVMFKGANLGYLYIKKDASILNEIQHEQWLKNMVSIAAIFILFIIPSGIYLWLMLTKPLLSVVSKAHREVSSLTEINFSHKDDRQDIKYLEFVISQLVEFVKARTVPMLQMQVQISAHALNYLTTEVGNLTHVSTVHKAALKAGVYDGSGAAVLPLLTEIDELSLTTKILCSHLSHPYPTDRIPVRLEASLEENFCRSLPSFYRVSNRIDPVYRYILINPSALDQLLKNLAGLFTALLGNCYKPLLSIEVNKMGIFSAHVEFIKIDDANNFLNKFRKMESPELRRNFFLVKLSSELCGLTFKVDMDSTKICINLSYLEYAETIMEVVE